MISIGLTAIASYLVGDIAFLALAKVLPAATARVAAPAVIKALKLMASQYGRAPKRTQQEWDEYARSHCSPDVWEALKNGR